MAYVVDVTVTVDVMIITCIIVDVDIIGKSV